MSSYDAYVNIVGGMKVDEPACDLGIAMSIVSSFKNLNVDQQIAAIGEIGLTGEIRAVNQIENRINEVRRLGFKKCIIPLGNYNMIKDSLQEDDFVIIPVEYVNEILNLLG